MIFCLVYLSVAIVRFALKALPLLAEKKVWGDS